MIGWRELVVTTVIGAAAVVVADKCGIIVRLAKLIP